LTLRSIGHDNSIVAVSDLTGQRSLSESVAVRREIARGMGFALSTVNKPSK
jgi:hypothetical protein